MILLSNGEVYLEKGEVIPMHCPCLHWYQPKEGTEFSICPKCGRRNQHDTVTLEPIEESELPFNKQ